VKVKFLKTVWYDNLYSPQMVAEQQRKITTKS